MNLRPDRLRMKRAPRMARKKAAKDRGARAKAELLLILQTVFGRDNVVTEHRFHETRQWRLDWAVPALKVAFEYDGHGSTGRMTAKEGAEGSGQAVGGHASVSGMANDAEKANAALLAGWRVFHFTALHFCGRSRRKHKLRAPMEVIEDLAKILRDESRPQQ